MSNLYQNIEQNSIFSGLWMTKKCWLTFVQFMVISWIGRNGVETIYVEILPGNIDFFSVESIARAIENTFDVVVI